MLQKSNNSFKKKTLLQDMRITWDIYITPLILFKYKYCWNIIWRHGLKIEKVRQYDGIKMLKQNWFVFLGQIIDV